MRLLGVFLVWLMSVTTVWAQEAQPTLEVTFEENETVPGQPLTLRLTVLVPTFMPSPPVWPDFESPNLRVQLPSKASSPTSKRIGGETWSGISRRYQVTPVVPGRFEIPAGEVQVRYRAPDGNGELEATLPVPAQVVTGVVPKGAEGMDPFLAATNVTLAQTVEGDTTGLAAGASFTRILEVQIDGVSPMFLPPFTPEAGVSGLRTYPESPVVEETENRGVVSGIRTEKTVYVVEASADGSLPEVRLQWFNLKTGKIEDAIVGAIEVQADAPSVSTRTAEPVDVEKVLRIAAAIGALALAVWAFKRWAAPKLRRYWKKVLHWWLNGANYAFRQFRKATKTRDLRASKQAYLRWSRKVPPASNEIEGAIEQAFLQIGAARFGQSDQVSEGQAWDRLKVFGYRKHRETRYRRDAKVSDLPPLNPAPTPQN